MPDDPNTPKPVPGRAPTLYAIIGLKLLKGVFFVVVAISVYTLSDNDLPVEYQNALHWLNRWTHLNPEKRFWVELATKVDKLTETEMVRAAAGTFVYSLFALVEGFGLICASNGLAGCPSANPRSSSRLKSLNCSTNSTGPLSSYCCSTSSWSGAPVPKPRTPLPGCTGTVRSAESNDLRTKLHNLAMIAIRAARVATAAAMPDEQVAEQCPFRLRQ